MRQLIKQMTEQAPAGSQIVNKQNCQQTFLQLLKSNQLQSQKNNDNCCGKQLKLQT